MKYNKVLQLFAVSLLIYSSVFYLSYLNIFNVSWLYNNSEYQSYQIAFEFFKNDSWRWPITSNPYYGIENNNILLSDNVPLLNIFFKLFSFLGTTNFQFYGLWVFLCFFLQCFFSYKIIYYYSKNNLFSFLSSIFFLFSPIFLDRIYFHLSLIAHWLILWAIYVSIKSLNKKRFDYKWLAILTISLLTNFYFFLIVVSIFSFFWIFNKNYNLLNRIKIIGFSYFYSLIILYLFGFFDINIVNYATYGFGFYKSNLLTLFDSSGGISSRNWSYFNIFDFKNVDGEQAGFGYLGFGGILLFFILLFNLFFNDKIKINFKILIFTILFFLISITHNVHIGEYNLFTLDLNKYLYGLLSFTRASGRFIFVVYYIICILGFIFVYKYFSKTNSIYICAFILFIQILDISSIFFEKNNMIKKNYQDLESLFWQNEVYGKYDTLNYSFAIGSHEILSKHVNLLSDSKFKKTNIFYQGRVDQKKLAKSRYSLYKKLSENSLSENELIILDLNHLTYLNHIYKEKNHGIVNRDNIWLLIKDKKKLMTKTDFIKLSKYSAKNLSKNKTIDENNISSYLGFGWYKSKSLWSEGYESTIIFNQDKDFQKILISCGLFFIEEDLTKLKFFINDKNITNNILKKKDNGYLIELNVKNLTKPGVNILKIINKNTKTRMDNLVAPDGRILGLKFISLEIL